MTTIAELPPGFADKVLSAQSTFRSVMEAMARPGTVQRVAASVGTPTGVARGTAAIALTLFDHDTPIWLDPMLAQTSEITRWLKFHTSAPVVVDSSIASFALIADAGALPGLDRFSFGTNEYPDRSTTLVIQVESLAQGPAYRLRGPGIEDATILQATVRPPDMFERLAVNAALFPRGIDVLLVCDDLVVALPRTTRIAAYGA